MNVGLQLNTRQQLAMTPEVQHSIWLLQLSGVEFEQALDEALVANPFLEREEADGASEEGVAEGGTEFSSPGSAQSDDIADIPSGEVSVEQPQSVAGDEWESSEWPRPSASRDGDDDFASFTPARSSLRDFLLQQAASSRLGKRDLDVAQMIINCLDSDGYLRESNDEIRALVSPPADDQELALALRFVQSLEPTGVGARNAVECILAQLAQCDSDDKNPCRALAARMLAEELEATASHDTVHLKKVFHCDDDALRAAYTAIKRCNPRPGAAFGADETRYVVADVIVKKQGKRWIASINPAVVPKIHLNELYADIINQKRGTAATPMGHQLHQARWFIRNVQQRFTTIQRVAQALVDRQSRFFEYGDVAMKPLVLRDLATELGLHESTISRVTCNKYMATSRGLVEMKYFFGSQIESDGNACSSTAVRALIRQIIASEDHHAPLSDIKVAKALGSKGVRIARRTVSKYRDSMQIPPVEARRMSAAFYRESERPVSLARTRRNSEGPSGIATSSSNPARSAALRAAV